MTTRRDTMTNLRTITDMDITIHSHGCRTNTVAPSTLEKMRRLAADGYSFIVGNNPTSKRPYGYDDALRVSQVNHRLHGKCIRTIWAVR